MITISGASHILIDARTVTSGDLAVSDVVLPSGSARDGAPPHADEVLDASGCVVTPGLVNAHHHLLQSAFRTLPGTRGAPMTHWLTTMGAAYTAVGVDPELCALAASVAVAEGLLGGVTTVADHHLTWPSGADQTAMAQASAHAAAGLGARLVFVRGSAGGDPEQTALSAEAIVQALLPGVSNGLSADGMLQLAVGPAGVHSDPRETFTLLAEVAARYGLRRRSQANEQVDVAVAAERYGRRPLDLLADWGWLAPDVTLAHLCGVTSAEIAALADAGVSATHAPGCDLPMGWGVAPVAALRAAGITVGLGTSGGGSNDAGHLLADARLALQVAPLAPLSAPSRFGAGDPGAGDSGAGDSGAGDSGAGDSGGGFGSARTLSAIEVLSMATEGSALGLGRAELGHLRPGAAADLCVWDVSGVADAGVSDPVAGLLWASPGRRPKHVVVAGRVVVRDGQLVNGDERVVAGRLRTLVKRAQG